MKALTQYRPLLQSGLGTWNPFQFENRIRRMFGPEMLADFPEGSFAWSPEIDLVDVDGEFVLTAELPGMKLEDVEIELADNVLTVKGEKHQFEHWKGVPFQVAERTYGAFERSFTLPRSVIVDKIHAELENGVLFVHLPKAEEARGRKIPIRPR